MPSHGSDSGPSMDVPTAHAGADSWLTLPSAGRIAGFGLLVFALLVFYEQVKMFLYRRAAILACPEPLPEPLHHNPNLTASCMRYVKGPRRLR